MQAVIETRSPISSVATALAVVVARVRKTARTGRVSGCPDRASAPAGDGDGMEFAGGPTHLRRDREHGAGSVPGQVLTLVGGSILIAAATDAGSIGALNPIVTGSVSPRSVENAVVKAAWASGTISAGGVATVVDGRLVPRTPIPRTKARPRAKPARARVERRNKAPR